MLRLAKDFFISAAFVGFGIGILLAVYIAIATASVQAWPIQALSLCVQCMVIGFIGVIGATLTGFRVMEDPATMF